MAAAALQRLVVDLACHGLIQPVFTLINAVLLSFRLISSVLAPKATTALANSPEASTLKERPSVVIVGASFAGLSALHDLPDICDITLVDFKSYHEYTPGTPRCFVRPEHFEHISGSLPQIHNTLMVAEVLDVEASQLLLRYQDGATGTLRFDYLVLGCGSLYASPWKPTPSEPDAASRLRTWEAAAAKLRDANSVLVIGGGPVGVELVAEIAEAFPGKKLTLVSRGLTLCGTMLPAVGDKVERWMKRRGVRLVLGVGVEGAVREKGCTLSDGRELTADIIYPCTGFKPNNAVLRAHFAEHLDASGAVLVNDHLQLRGHPRIYALGDVMVHGASGEAKLGHTAELNAHCAAANIRRQILGLKLLTYPHGATGIDRAPRIFCVSLGKHDAVLAFNQLVLSGPLAAITKWLLEWTKVKACDAQPVGLLFWKVADYMSVLLTRTLLPLESRADAAAAT